MATSVEQLTRLAAELTDRVDQLEAENADLRGSIAKRASAAPAVQAPVVREATLNSTCAALVSAGAIREDQVSLTKQAFRKDPETAHRVIVGLAQTQQKLAAAQRDGVNLSGGSLVDGPATGRTAQEDCLDNLQRILGMY